MSDAAPAPSMGIDSAAVAADVAKLTSAGIPAEQAQVMAHGRARQLRDLSDMRGEHTIELVDADAQLAAELDRAMTTPGKGEAHTWEIPAEGDSDVDREAATAATVESRRVAVALGLTPDTARTLMERIGEGLARADEMDADAYTAHAKEGLARLVERYGDEATARAWVRDAVSALKTAGADQRVIDAFRLGGATDWWSVELLARRHRARSA